MTLYIVNIQYNYDKYASLVTRTSRFDLLLTRQIIACGGEVKKCIDIMGT